MAISVYKYGNETYYVDPSSGAIYDSNGNRAFNYDYRTGSVTDLSGSFLGTLSSSGDFTNNSGRTATPTATSYIQTDIGAALAPGGSGKSYAGQYNFQNGHSFSVGDNGNITDLSTGDVIGKVDNLGRVYSTSGALLGTLSKDKFGDATFRDLTGNVATTYPTLSGSATGGGGASVNQAGALGAPGGGTGSSSFDEHQYINDFLHGLLKETTQQFFNARDVINDKLAPFINNSFQRQQGILDELNYLGHETFNILDPIRKGLQSDVSDYALGLRNLQGSLGGISSYIYKQIRNLSDILQQTSGVFSEATNPLLSLLRESAGRESPFLRAASPAQSLLEAQAKGDLFKNIYGREENIAGAAARNLLSALAGNISLPVFMQQDLERAERELEDRLRRNLGTGYETSTAGIDALMQYERLRAGALDEFRRQELERMARLVGQSDTTLLNATQAQSSNVSNLANVVGELLFKRAGTSSSLGSTLGNLASQHASSASTIESTIGNLLAQEANIQSQIAQLPLQSAAAKSGLVNDISNIANLGFNMGGSLLQQTAQTAGLPLMLSSAQQSLASNAIDSLGRGALLPAQNHATYLGLLFSALQPATSTPVNPANVLASLTTQTANAANAGYNLANLASNLYQANQLGSYVRGSGLSEALANILGGVGRTIPQMAGR
jgi:hypothetical protein